MKCMIYTCHHMVPDHTLNLPMFSTLVSGVAPPRDREFQSDLDGENIAERLEHSEMRHQYYVWRNKLTQYDYVGFEHYRRLFFLDPLPIEQLTDRYPALEQARYNFASDQHLAQLPVTPADFKSYLAMRRDLTAEAQLNLKNWIAGHDIIAQRPLFRQPLDEQWKSTHMAELWDALVNATIRNSYFDHQKFRANLAMPTPHYCNMYIMKSEIFDEYMRFWWNSMNILAKNITIYPRLLGHFAERLFNIFLMQKRMQSPLLRVATLPHLFLET